MMHSARLADPLDPVVKEIKKISSILKKNDEHHQQIAELEFTGGMYYVDGVGPMLPAANLRRAFIDAARKTKDGKQIEQGLFVDTMVNPLAYDGPRTVEELWKDKRFVNRMSVKVQSARVMRTRPIFEKWAVDAEFTYDPELLNFDQLCQFARTAGTYIGLGDYRPLFGRFYAELQEMDDSVTAA